MTRFVLVYLIIFAVNLAIYSATGERFPLAIAFIAGAAAMANYRGPYE